jgi:hypothetical protein
MRISRKFLALGLASGALAATAGAVAAAGAAHAATARPSVTIPSVTAITDSSVSLAWTLSNGARKADIQVYPIAVGPQAFHQVVSGTSVTVTGLADDTTYYARASAMDASGRTYGWSGTNLIFTKSSFGVGQVFVDTGTGYAKWASFSAPLESNDPEGDVTSGFFRFSCGNTAAGCNVQLRAYATAPGFAVSPRILIHREVSFSPPTFIEYGEGANNSGATAPLTTTSAAIPVGYGSSWDSGGNNPGSPDGAIVLNVPGGAGYYYDVSTNWTFSKP